MRGKPLDEHIDLDAVAKGTPGFVGADIENMVNEAALLAAAGRAVHPETEQKRRLVKALRARRRRQLEARDRAVLARTGIRIARESEEWLETKLDEIDYTMWNGWPTQGERTG